MGYERTDARGGALRPGRGGRAVEGRRARSAAQAEGLSLASYERSVIAHVYRTGGPDNALRSLTTQAREELGEPTLSLRFFNEHGGFPLKLIAAKLRLVEMPMGDVFKRPTVTPIHKAYAEAREEYPEDQAIVLVFRWRLRRADGRAHAAQGVRGTWASQPDQTGLRGRPAQAAADDLHDRGHGRPPGGDRLGPTR